jgi:hypothetical protein
MGELYLMVNQLAHLVLCRTSLLKLGNFTGFFDEVLNDLDLILYLWSDFIKFM